MNASRTSKGLGAAAHRCGLVLCLGAAIVACDDDDDRAQLQHVAPTGKMGMAKPGTEPLDHESPLTPPDEYRRAEAEMEAESGPFEATVKVEEITNGLRVSAEVDGAAPGNYFISFHDDESCGPKLGAPIILTAGAQDPSAAQLGTMDVDDDGGGQARWTTNLGSLRAGEDDSVLGKVVAVYRAPRPGERVACGIVER